MRKPYLQKCTALLLSLVLLFTFASCTNNKQVDTSSLLPQDGSFTLGKGADTPEEAIEYYMSAYFNMNADLLMDYSIPRQLENGDWHIEDFSFFSTADTPFQEAQNLVLQTLSIKGSFNLSSVSYTASNAATLSVYVVTYPCEKIFSPVDMEVYGLLLSGAYIKDIQGYRANRYIEELEDSSIPPSAYYTNFTAYCINGRWYVQQVFPKLCGDYSGYWWWYINDYYPLLENLSAEQSDTLLQMRWF